MQLMLALWRGIALHSAAGGWGWAGLRGAAEAEPQQGGAWFSLLGDVHVVVGLLVWHSAQTREKVDQWCAVEEVGVDWLLQHMSVCDPALLAYIRTEQGQADRTLPSGPLWELQQSHMAIVSESPLCFPRPLLIWTYSLWTPSSGTTKETPLPPEEKEDWTSLVWDCEGRRYFLSQFQLDLPGASGDLPVSMTSHQ